MKEHKSDLIIHSENEVGTTIELIFPFKAKDCVLVDDDALICLTWETRAKKAGIMMSTFSSAGDFIKAVNSFNKDTSIYLDYEIKGSELSGLDLAKKLNQMGYKELFLTTGHNPEQIPSAPFIKKILSKKPPF